MSYQTRFDRLGTLARKAGCSIEYRYETIGSTDTTTLVVRKAGSQSSVVVVELSGRVRPSHSAFIQTEDGSMRPIAYGTAWSAIASL